MKIIGSRYLAALSLAIWAGSISAQAQCAGYSVEIFAGPDCLLPSFAGAWGISDAGAICGGYVDCGEVGHHVIWWPNGDMMEMPPSADGGTPDDPREINNAGQVAGTMYLPGPAPNDRAFLYTDGVTLNLGMLPDCNKSEAMAINESGIVCGYSHNTGTGPFHAFLWQNGRMSALKLPFGKQAVANDISYDGSVCGWMGDTSSTAHAFIWKDGVVQDLGVIPNGISAKASGISDNGKVCGAGIAVTPDGTVLHAFYWENGQMIELGTLPGLPYSTALKVNNAGQVVGRSYNEALVGPAFIWRNGVMTELNSLIPLELNLNIRHAWDINNAGQIVGEATVIGTPDRVAVRLTPIPSPIGDFNCDSNVDVDDLLGVINTWADTPMKGSNALPPADFNQDSIVDHEDLMIVLDNWTF